MWETVHDSRSAYEISKEKPKARNTATTPEYQEIFVVIWEVGEVTEAWLAASFCP